MTIKRTLTRLAAHISIMVLTVLTVAGCAGSPERHENWLNSDLELIPAVNLRGVPVQEHQISSRMNHYGVSAVSIAVLRDGQIISSQSLGMISAESSISVTPQTQFQAASLSKPVTAVAALQLVNAGLVSLDDFVGNYLNEWVLPGSLSSDSTTVTLTSLLSHSAGVSVKSYPGFEQGSDWPSLDDILEGRENAYSPRVEALGVRGKYAYSGGGYMVVQKLIESQMQASFEESMQRELFQPLGMSRSTFAQLTPTDQIARGHDWHGNPMETGWHDYPQAAAAGLWSTPTDIARLLVSLSAAYAGETDAVVSPKIARRMTQEVVEGTGLGFGVHGEGKELHLSHAGWTTGYRSYLLLYPESGDGIVIMTNGQAGNQLIAEILRAAALEYSWTAIEPSLEFDIFHWDDKKIKSLTGRYTVSPAGFELKILTDGNGFILETPRGSSYLAYPISASELIIIDTGDRVQVDLSGPHPRLSLWGMTAE